MTSTRGVAVLVIAGLSVGSCAAPTDPAPTPDVSGANGLLALYRADEAGEGAILVGRLELEGPCLYVVDEGGARWLAAWPFPGTTWDAASTSVNLRGTRLAVGETGSFGGGEARLDPSNIDSFDWVALPPEECLVANAWFIYTLQRSP